MHKIKNILKVFDAWLHDRLRQEEDCYYRHVNIRLPKYNYDEAEVLSAIHLYDMGRFGSQSLYHKLKINLKSSLYTLYILTRRKTLSLLLRIFLFRDKVLGRSK